MKIELLEITFESGKKVELTQEEFDDFKHHILKEYTTKWPEYTWPKVSWSPILRGPYSSGIVPDRKV